MVIIISRRIFRLAEFSSHSNDKTIILKEFPNNYIGILSQGVANVQVRPSVFPNFYGTHNFRKRDGKGTQF